MFAKRHFALSIIDGRMGYRLSRIPFPTFLLHAVAWAWNRVACRIKGHEFMECGAVIDDVIYGNPGKFACIWCCKEGRRG